MSIFLHLLLSADEIIGDDESHWQDRVSSGFDRLVAFASTELTKTGRHSIDEASGGGGGGSSTSPDSGINNSSSEGSGSRTFLSTSSTSSSSQMDALPLVTTGLTVNTVPSVKCSSVELLDSPNFPDAGLPRTPSPSASPSPLLAIYPTAVTGPSVSIMAQVPMETSNSLQIPLKYQRHHQQKHYKKKFRERTWEEYDYEESVSGGSMGGTEPDPSTSHKSSKFRPKGKDWDWRSDQYRGNQQKAPDATDVAPA